MGAAEVVEVDLVGAAAERQLVGEGAARHAAAAVLLEDVRLRAALQGVDRVGLLHVALGVGVGHHFDRRRELHLAVGVVVVGVGVDHHRHRLVGEGLHLVEQRLAPAGQLGVDQHHAGGGQEHRGVAAAALEHVERVGDLVGLDHLRRAAAAACKAVTAIEPRPRQPPSESQCTLGHEVSTAADQAAAPRIVNTSPGVGGLARRRQRPPSIAQARLPPPCRAMPSVVSSPPPGGPRRAFATDIYSQGRRHPALPGDRRRRHRRRAARRGAGLGALLTSASAPGRCWRSRPGCRSSTPLAVPASCTALARARRSSRRRADARYRSRWCSSSPYLRLIALLLLFLNVINTTGEYILALLWSPSQAVALSAAVPSFFSTAFISSFYGGYFLWVNIASVVVAVVRGRRALGRASVMARRASSRCRSWPWVAYAVPPTPTLAG